MRVSITLLSFFWLTHIKMLHFLSWLAESSYTKIGNLHDDFVFDQAKSFLHKDTQVPDYFLTWTRYAVFIGWIFCIFQVSYGKKDSANPCSVLPVARNNKSKKNRQKFTSAKILQCWWFVKCSILHVGPHSSPDARSLQSSAEAWRHI